MAGELKSEGLNVAIKAHGFQERYIREKDVYERLLAAKVCVVEGFEVPQLLGFDDLLKVIEMTIVSRPFVLDFASAHLDVRPAFTDEIWEQWEIEKREQFEERWPTVQAIMDAFEELGIYLTDVTPNNIGFVLDGENF